MRFKVGDRVRCVRPWKEWGEHPLARRDWERIRGAEGVVDNPLVMSGNGLYAVGVNVYGEEYAMPEWGLEPIIGPDEKSWEHFESLKDLQDFRIPAPPAQVVTLGDGA